MDAESAVVRAEVASPLPGQLACLILASFTVALWIASEYTCYFRPDGRHSKSSDEDERIPLTAPASSKLASSGQAHDGIELPRRNSLGGGEGGSGSGSGTPSGGAGAGSSVAVAPPPPSSSSSSPPHSSSLGSSCVPPASPGALQSDLWRCACLDPEALRRCRPALRAAAEVAAWLAWFFLADRTPAVGASGKTYSRDMFVFLCLCIFAVALAYTRVTSPRPPVLAGRPQTEEWKGWMQIMFLLYHYFNAKEIYNAIRVFIAGYVWLTGYGNFSYYYRTGDFGYGRFAQMMWRLNFLVALCCAALGNSYMLYYICPMHTLFTVLVYATLALGARRNRASAAFVWAKLGAALLLTALVWETPGLFDLLWRPLRFLVGYVDPRRAAGAANPDAMHEWRFRSGLDRYVWIHGMACAFLHPAFERLLARVDALPPRRAAATRAAACLAALAAGAAWYLAVFRLPKREYNRLHPYTSWIPISCFLVLRNATPRLRQTHLGLFAWTGVVTLETYIGQFHTWLLSKRRDGQPVYLLCLVPSYPYLNFAVVTAIYVLCSHRLFKATVALKNALVPHDNDRMLLRNAVMLATLAAGLYLAGAGLATTFEPTNGGGGGGGGDATAP